MGLDDNFGVSFKQNEVTDQVTQQQECSGDAVIFIPYNADLKDAIFEQGADHESMQGLRPIYIDEV